MTLAGAAVLLLAVAQPHVTRAELAVTFVGNAAFHITDGQVAILTDFPYDPGEHFMHWSPEGVPQRPTNPLCLFTHTHRDHFARELVAGFCGQVLGPPDVAAAGVPPIPLVGELSWQGVVIHPIKTPHADLEHYSYLIEWHGLRLFFSGDTDDPSAVLAAKGLDAAFLTPWLLRTLQQRGASLDARLVVSQHHNAGDPVPNFQSRLVLKQGDTLRIGPRNAAE